MAGWKEVVFAAGSVADLDVKGAAQGNLMMAGADPFTYTNFTAGAANKVLTAHGVAAALTWETPCSASGTEEGSIMVSAVTTFNYTEFAHGTSGQVLTTGGHGAQPTWETPTVGDFKADGTVPMTGDLDMDDNCIRDMKLYTTVPGVPADGHIYFDTATDKVKVYVA